MENIEITFLMNPPIIKALGLWLLASIIKWVVTFFRG